MLYTGGDHKILGRVMLQHQPHAFHIVPGIAPVTLAVKVAELQLVLQTAGDTAGGAGDLSRDEILAAALGLMVEEDAVNRKHPVSFTVFLHHPEAVLLGDGIGAVRMERCGLALRNLFHFAEELRSRRLIETAGLRDTDDAHGLQQAKHPQRVNVAGILGHVKADLNMALGCKIVNLVGPDERQDADQACGIAQVAIVQRDLAQQMRDTVGIGKRCASGDAVHFISFFKQKLGEIRAVLPGDAGDQSFFHVSTPLM